MGYGLTKDGAATRAAVRSVLLTSPDAHFRTRLREQLTAMRWQVREATGGADAIAQLEEQAAEALVLDSVLPDLDVSEFASEVRKQHPVMDLLRINAGGDETGVRSPRRNELLHALRQALEETQGSSVGDGSAWLYAPAKSPDHSATGAFQGRGQTSVGVAGVVSPRDQESLSGNMARSAALTDPAPAGHPVRLPPRVQPLPDMVGSGPRMAELAHMIRLVAPRSTTVLIQGDTGTGKELVARAVHQLSPRASKPFVVLNCAAIPESLLEAELFGHTRGAFTGAVQSRAGRIEAANGGTLFLDEIGEMPLSLQAKMLRFLESGELQRVGDNEMTHVDVRVIAASHQPLLQRSIERTFRLDLYHRLAVFPVSVPPLRDRLEDILPLSTHLLDRLGEGMPVKRLSACAAERLMEHAWPGNVRELAHVLERGTILAEDRREITAAEIRI
jgi:DNA-binding NtrC family response regulator